jgi:NAD(P)-dependent dehydrogenase (short-subunit alcohol dehydrogenase family)
MRSCRLSSSQSTSTTDRIREVPQRSGAQYGITVYAVAPGFVQTEIVKEGRMPEEHAGLIQTIEEHSSTCPATEVCDVRKGSARLMVADTSPGQFKLK